MTTTPPTITAPSEADSGRPPADPLAGDATAIDEAPPFEHFSGKWPAMIVLGIAVALVAAMFVAAAFDTGSAPTTTVRSVTLADGTVVRLTTAGDVLAPIVADELPPSDIIGALEVPVGTAQAGGAVDTDQNAGQYDRTMPLSVELDSDEVTETFQVLLPRLGWQVISTGTDPYAAGDTEVLAKRASSDGYYWEAGVVVSPTNNAGTTPFSVRVFQVPDDST